MRSRRKEKPEMARSESFRSLLLLVVGGVLGGIFVSAWERPTAIAQGTTNPATIQTDVARLKDITPPNSHPMVDVAMFAANIWFAGEKKNWPLANYYLGEMRNRMRWEVHLNPGPKGADGNPVDMASIFDGIDKGSLTTVKASIDAKNSQQFAAEYKHMLEDCYSCHKTAGRPYLRPMVPTTGAQPIVNLDPTATWPE
jgi:hypothetical protein